MKIPDSFAWINSLRNRLWRKSIGAGTVCFTNAGESKIWGEVEEVEEEHLTFKAFNGKVFYLSKIDLKIV